MSVQANEQWLKAYIAQHWFSLLLATRGVPANLDGEARAMMIIAGAVTKAVDNGTILPGKMLFRGTKTRRDRCDWGRFSLARYSE